MPVDEKMARGPERQCCRNIRPLACRERLPVAGPGKAHGRPRTVLFVLACTNWTFLFGRRPRLNGASARALSRRTCPSKFTPCGPRQALLLPFLRNSGWLQLCVCVAQCAPFFARGAHWNLTHMSGRSLIHWCVLLCCIADHCGSVLALQLSRQVPESQQTRICALQLHNLKQASRPRTVLRIMCTAIFL